MNIDQFKEELKRIEGKTQFVVSWVAKKYKKTIFRVGTMDKPGCKSWKQNGLDYMCFWDTALERYTTCINPTITWKKARH